MPRDMTVEEFMSRIAGIESGGASDPTNVAHPRTGAHGIFQIMPSNWSPWAREAGLSANAPRTAENQRRVARHKMQQYREQFGSWDAAAVAWFAGPDRARRFNEGDQAVLRMSDGHSTVSEYLARLNQGRTQGLPQTADHDLGTQVGPQQQDQPDLGDIAQQRDPRIGDLWGHMMSSMSEQIRSGRGEEAAPAWVEPQPDNPIAPGVEGDPDEPGDLGVPSDGRTEAAGTGQAGEFLNVANQLVGTPYVWGGADPSGFDCSGLIQYAAKQIGVNVPRVSRDQAKAGVEVNLSEARPGDLIAFPARGLEVGHIGILVDQDDNGNWRMLHAPRSGTNVRIDPIGRRQVATVRRIFEQDAPQQPGQIDTNPQAPGQRHFQIR